jgi:hypothetical protein
MELRVTIGTSHGGITNYAIAPARMRRYAGYSHQVYASRDLGRLYELAPRIESMAKGQLGKAFVQMLDRGSYFELRVKQGTSKNDKTKFKLRNLFGWICLFDAEEKRPQTRKRKHK